MIATRRRVLGKVAKVAIGLVIAPLAAAALLPISFDSNELLFEIPKGTWSRRMAGENAEILPSELRLVAGHRDILVLRNLDDVPQIFGPSLLMPGQTIRIPFSEPSENHFVCTAHASGSIVVIVEAAPTTPWARLAWRTRALFRWVSHDR